jgi:hypothetical protein
VDSLKNQTKISVTKENFESLSLLAEEFCFEELQSECSKMVPVPTLSEQFFRFEEQIKSQERRLENLCHEIEKMKQSQTRIESQERELKNVGLEIEKLKKLFESSPTAKTPDSPKPIRDSFPSPQPGKSPKKLSFPPKETKPVEGIISYLTTNHGGNVHETGIVTITSKSIYRDDPLYTLKNVADLTYCSWFQSKNEPDQWICWDFHEMRVRLAHYTIRTGWLKSWVVEGSLDGENWTEIDRKTDNQDLKYAGNNKAVSFTVSKPVESRFIRLTQTGKDHNGNDYLFLVTVDFFRTLSE